MVARPPPHGGPGSRSAVPAAHGNRGCDRRRRRRVWPSAQHVVAASAQHHRRTAAGSASAGAGDQERRGSTAAPSGLAATVAAGPGRCGGFTRSSATSFSSGRGSLCSGDGTAAFEGGLEIRRASSSASSHRLLAAPASCARRPRVSWSPETWTQQPDVPPVARKLSLNPKLVFVRSAEDEASRRRRRRSHSAAKALSYAGPDACPNFGAPLLRYP